MYITGKRKREELSLPQLRYVVADDWIDKLGNDAFCAWIRFHTWVDRRDADREEDKIPYSLKLTWEKLGMSKAKFYRSVIRPLWEHGLIDIIEYEDSKIKGQKPKNIIVYKSPFDSHAAEIQPISKIRDYEKDYISISQTYGKQGGAPKKNKRSPGFKNETPPGFKNETGSVSKMKPNNSSNDLYNSSNDINNDSNKQQQGGGKQNFVVVQNEFEMLFKQELSKKKAMQLITIAEEHKADLLATLHNTHSRHLESPCDNIIGAIIYDIKNGWDLNLFEPTVSSTGQRERILKMNLPKAVKQQLIEKLDMESHSM